MGKILEEEIESDNEIQEEILNINKKPQKKQKIKREKLIQKVKEIEIEGNKDGKKRIRSRKNKNNNDPQNKFLQEQQLSTKNPSLFKQFMGKLQGETDNQLQTKRQIKTMKNQRLKKKEKLKQDVQNKMKFRKLVNEIESDIPKHKKKDNMEQTMQFNGFDDEFNRIQKQSQRELELQKYQQAQGVSNKNKNNTQNQEVKRMQQVLRFQPFRQNPLEALKTHIQNTQN